MRPIYKILIIIGVIVVAGLLVYFVWGIFTKEPAPAEETTAQTGLDSQVAKEGGGQQQSETQKRTVKKLSDHEVFDFWTVKGSGEVYYIAIDGKIFNAKEGPDLEISTQTIDAMNFIEPAAGGAKILAAFGNPAGPRWGIFDVFDKVWRPLSNDLIYAIWAGNDSKLIATIKKDGQINLVEADLSKNPTEYKNLIKNFGLKDFNFIFKPPQSLLIIEKSSAAYKARLWQLDLKTLVLNLLISPQEGLELEPSLENNIFFQFRAPDELVVLDSDLNLIATEFSFVTLPSKCAAKATSTVYCFEPQNLTGKIVLPDDYLQRKFYSTDNLTVLDLGETESVGTVFYSGQDNAPIIDGYNPRISGNDLYFINRYDNGLYVVGL